MTSIGSAAATISCSMPEEAKSRSTKNEGCSGGIKRTVARRPAEYELIQQKAVDVGLAFHLMRSHSHRKWSKLFLAAGDSDFHEAVQHLVEHEDVDLVLIGTPNSISNELRPYARNILELDKIAAQVARPAIAAT